VSPRRRSGDHVLKWFHMRRLILWIILGGVVLIAGVIIFQLLGTYFYMRSPQRVVDGAFTRFLDAKSFNFSLEGQNDAKDGLLFKVSGSMDKSVITAPIAEIKFSFDAPSQKMVASGQAVANDGKLYFSFDKLVGLNDVLPGTIQSLWTEIGFESLLAVVRDRVFPDATGNFTEADLKEVAVVVKKHLPFSVSSEGKQLFIGNVLVIPYDVILDRKALIKIAKEIKTAVKGEALSSQENIEIEKYFSSMPAVTGQVWVGKKDGMLREMVLVTKGNDTAFHLNLHFSDYDKTVTANPPNGAKPLAELFRRLFGTSLSGVKPKLPFDLPAPIWDINMSIPVVTLPEGGSGGSQKTLGGLPNLLKLFYGTDKLFESNK